MNHKSIQILRGSATYDPKTSTEVLLDGQPFYSKKTEKLYIGNGVDPLSKLEGTKIGVPIEELCYTEDTSKTIISVNRATGIKFEAEVPEAIRNVTELYAYMDTIINNPFPSNFIPIKNLDWGGALIETAGIGWDPDRGTYALFLIYSNGNHDRLNYVDEFKDDIRFNPGKLPVSQKLLDIEELCYTDKYEDETIFSINAEPNLKLSVTIPTIINDISELDAYVRNVTKIDVQDASYHDDVLSSAYIGIKTDILALFGDRGDGGGVKALAALFEYESEMSFKISQRRIPVKEAKADKYIETTETNVNNLPKENGFFKNSTGFTTNIPGFNTYPLYIVKQEVYTCFILDTETTFAVQKCAAWANSVLLYQRTGYAKGSGSITWSAWQQISDMSGNAYATKLGTATVGSGTQLIYLNGGTPAVSTSTVGTTKIPVYLKEGELTAAADVLNIDDMFNTKMTSVQIGTGADATQNYGVVIGNDATDGGWQCCTVIGHRASIGDTLGTNSNYGIAIGCNAKCVGNYGVQIGPSINTKANTIYYYARCQATNSDKNMRVPHLEQDEIATNDYVTIGSFYGPTGYMRFDNGLLMVWGGTNISKSGTGTISWTPKFTSTKTFTVFISNCGTGEYSYSWTAEPASLNSATVTYGNNNGPYPIRWMAIGY